MGYIGNVRPTIALASSDIADGAITAAKLAAGAVETDEIVDADNNTKVQVEEGADDNIIRFDTAGSERMIIDAGGSVGIGTSSPTRQMELKGSTDNGPLVIDTASGAHAGIWLKENGTDRWQVYSEASSGDLTFFNYGTSEVDMRIKANGFATGQFVVKVWVRYNGTGTIAINDSYNVSSITDNGTGNTTINFSSNFPNTNYACAGTNNWYGIANFASSAVGSVGHSNRDINGSMRDASVCHAMIIGD